MKRRTFLAGLVAAGTAPAMALAQSVTDVLVAQLKEAGFTRIMVGRTWLGRVRIVATNDFFRREIIINPRTGEILRDIWYNLQSGRAGTGLYNPDDEEDNYRRSGGYDDDEEDDDEKDDEEDDEDNSGSGSSNSGSGSSNSGSGSSNSGSGSSSSGSGSSGSGS